MVYIPCNIGNTERYLRFGLGAALLGVGIGAKMRPIARVAAGVAGGMELVSGLTSYCPINQLIGRNTCPTAHKPHEWQLAEKEAS